VRELTASCLIVASRAVQGRHSKSTGRQMRQGWPFDLRRTWGFDHFHGVRNSDRPSAGPARNCGPPAVIDASANRACIDLVGEVVSTAGSV